MHRPTLLLVLIAFGMVGAGCQTEPPHPHAAKAASPEVPVLPSRPVRVACLGDSITAGSGTADPAKDAYPVQLQRLLDAHTWLVRGFGVSGATLMNSGDKPYRHLPVFAAAREFNPDIVIIMLGTNDSKPNNWTHHQDFTAEYVRLIAEVRAWPGSPRVLICQPPIVTGAGKFGITSAIVEQERPLIREIANRTRVAVIPMNAALVGHEDMLPDGVHPDGRGAALLAQCAAGVLTRASSSGP